MFPVSSSLCKVNVLKVHLSLRLSSLVIYEYETTQNIHTVRMSEVIKKKFFQL